MTTTAVAKETEEKPEIKFLELAEVPPMIGLAIGKQAVAYWPAGGMVSGEETLETFFGKDLGFSSEFCCLVFLFRLLFRGCWLAFSFHAWFLGGCAVVLTLLVIVCWNHMRLGEEMK